MAYQTSSRKSPHFDTPTMRGRLRDETFEAGELCELHYWSDFAEDCGHRAYYCHQEWRMSLDHTVSSAEFELIKMASHGDHRALIALAEAMPQMNLDAENFEGQIALHAACGAGSYEGVKALLDSGASLRRKDGGGHSPLHHAASSRDRNAQTVVLSLLLDLGATVDETNHQGVTPFLAACSAGNIVAAQALLDMSANFWHKDDFGQDCFSLAGSSWRHGDAPEGADIVEWLNAARDKAELASMLHKANPAMGASPSPRIRQRL